MTIQSKLAAKIVRLSKVQVRHRVEAYRRTESARALLSVALDRHNNAVKWRSTLLNILGTTPDVTVRVIHVKAPFQKRYRKVFAYSANGKDIAIVTHNGAHATTVMPVALSAYIKMAYGYTAQVRKG